MKCWMVGWIDSWMNKFNILIVGWVYLVDERLCGGRVVKALDC